MSAKRGKWMNRRWRRKRKLTIRQTEGAGDERIRRGSRGSEEEAERERHERRESVVLPKTLRGKKMSVAVYPKKQREERK